MQKTLMMLLLIFGLPLIVCSQPPSDSTAQQKAPPSSAAREKTPPTPQQEQALQIAEGTLSRVDSQKQFIWIKTMDGNEMQFSYTNDTQVEGSGNTAEGLAKMSGNILRVHYRTEIGGIQTAVKIEILAERT